MLDIATAGRFLLAKWLLTAEAATRVTVLNGIHWVLRYARIAS